MEEELLSQRKQQILMGAVEDYIASASPITSGAVHKNIISTISPATLRAELNALEAMGYLKQLHTSGGRVPTSKAYRLYVNSLMGEVEFEIESLHKVKSILEARTTSMNDIISKLSKTIAQATDYPAMVMFNGLNKLTLQSVRIFPLMTGELLVLLQTNAGIINNTIATSQPVTEQNCLDASNFLTKTFQNKTIEEMIENINSLENEMLSQVEEFKGLINIFIDSLTEIASKRKVNVSNTTKLLEMPEYSSVEKAKEIIKLFEDEKAVEELLSEETNQDISFKIGKENNNQALKECSVVKADFKVDGKNVASIGIVGPERMDYVKIASALKYVIDEIKEINKLQYKKDGDN